VLSADPRVLSAGASAFRGSVRGDIDAGAYGSDAGAYDADDGTYGSDAGAYGSDDGAYNSEKSRTGRGLTATRQKLAAGLTSSLGPRTVAPFTREVSTCRTR
jgi:hypothetical protein